MTTAGFPPQVQAIAQRARQLVKAAAPQVQERVYKGQRGYGYHDEVCGAFCGLFLRKEAAYLMLRDGAFLPDPHKLLHGKGDRFLYVTLRPGQPLHAAGLSELVRAALEFGRDRHAK